MRKLRFSASAAFQLVFSFLVLFCTYLLFALLDLLEMDMVGAFGWILIQPVLGIILTTLTQLICLVIGLPIRLFPALRSFWIKNGWISCLLLVSGAVLLVLSVNHRFAAIHREEMDGYVVERHTPDAAFAVTGWFLMAFAILHLYPHPVLSWLKRKGAFHR